jgi:putative membrane protein
MSLPGPASPATPSTGLADGEWHRMHKATPLLRGGIALVFLAGVVLANLRERIASLLLHTPDPQRGDPIDAIIDHNVVLPALGVAVLVIVLCVAVFWLSWRVQTFRVTEQAVELRSGILRRQERKARLDRVQGIDVQRPVLARLFGAARLEVIVAGRDGNLQLRYLSSHVVESLRREILRLVREAGARGTEGAAVAGGGPAELAGWAAPNPGERTVGETPASPSLPGSPSVPGNTSTSGWRDRARDIVTNRVDEFLVAPADLDPDAAPPASVVHMHPGRLAGSLVLSPRTLILVALIVAMIASHGPTQFLLVVTFIPVALGLGGIYVRRFTKALRYSIAGSDHGVRIGFGLLTTSSETIPPRRIHAVELHQPLTWRPFGWWQVRMNTAEHMRGRDSAGEARTTTLPVGDIDDVRRVLPLLLPDMDAGLRDVLASAGMDVRADQSAFSRAPRRAGWLRPFSWRRTGMTIADGVVVMRHGLLVRRVMFVPLARLQSVEVEQGPARRALGLAALAAHVVEGPVHPRVPVADVRAAEQLFARVGAAAIASAAEENGGARRAGGEIVGRETVGEEIAGGETAGEDTADGETPGAGTARGEA